MSSHQESKSTLNDKKHLTHIPQWRLNIRRWFINHSRDVIFMSAWLCLNGIVLSIQIDRVTSPKFGLVNRILGAPLIIARTAAAGINLNIPFLILSVCRNFLKSVF